MIIDNKADNLDWDLKYIPDILTSYQSLSEMLIGCSFMNKSLDYTEIIRDELIQLFSELN